MDEPALRRLLDQVRSGAVSPDDGVHQLRRLPFADLGYARVDHHRALRQGLPEAVYAPGKTAEQCAGIVAELLAEPHGGPVVLSRATPDQVAAAMAANPGGRRSGGGPAGETQLPADPARPAGETQLRADPARAPGEARLPDVDARRTPGATVVWRAAPPRPERVVVATVGTADLLVAEECRATLAAFGVDAVLLADVGVAGLHRLLSQLHVLEGADAVVVVAGMEGALASVIGGLTACPVVAVPTSVGYGASLEGVTALLAMLAGCAAGVVVTGIDNGFGAAHAVARLIGPPSDPAGSAASPGADSAESSPRPRMAVPPGRADHPEGSHLGQREADSAEGPASPAIPGGETEQVAADGAGALTTIAWWHCFSGIAGDMALGSLVDAGADLEAVVAQLAGLAVPGWTIEAEAVTRGGVAATHLDVRVTDTESARHHADIVRIIEGADLPERARARALATFARLAEVEGRLHRLPPEHVHFHEVGGVDAIVDIVGTCVALELLGIDEVRSSPVAQGIGMVRSAHGLIPNPVPATIELLRGAPTYGTDVRLELTTPTGAALVSTLATGWGPMPAMEITASGFGAGTRDLEGRPNALQVVIGTSADTEERAGGQEVALLEANLDDVTGEILAHVLARLLDAGAHDAWLTPIVGKKGRPAHIVSVLADPVLAGRLRAVLMAETGSIGVRSQGLVRWPAARHMVGVEVDSHPVQVKVTQGRVKAEFDDTARVGALLGIPAREVARRAEQAAHDAEQVAHRAEQVAHREDPPGR